MNATAVLQLTDNSVADHACRINDRDSIVWLQDAVDGFNYDVFLATPCDSDDDGYDSTSCGGDDCDDTNSNIHPTNSNTYCDCEDPYPQGTDEICGDGVDNDCDGLTDTDPECSGTCTASVVGATYETSPVRGSACLGKHLAYFLLPIGTIFGLFIWRRKR